MTQEHVVIVLHIVLVEQHVELLEHQGTVGKFGGRPYK